MDLLALVPDAGGWAGLLAAAGLCGLLALDDTAWGQTWFSQPLPAGLLAGILGGDALTGVAVGLPLQLVLVGNIPVGQTFTGDPTVATVAAVTAALRAGRHLHPARLFSDEGLPLAGWLLVGAALLSLAGHLLVQAERRAHVPLMLEGHRTLRDGDLGRIVRLHRRAVLLTAVRGAVTGVLAVLLLEKLWIPLLGALPDRLQQACAMTAVLLPGLGIGTLVDRYGLVRALPWLAGGLVAGAVLVGVVL